MNIRALSFCLVAWWWGAAAALAESHAIRLQVFPETFELGLTGPADERFVLEWSTNLVRWDQAETNQFDLFGRPVRFSLREADALPPVFYRARRYEPPEGCVTLLCFREPPADGTTNCPVYGPPDLRDVREAAIPHGAAPIKSIRLMLHVLADDAGNNPAATNETILAQLRTLNAHFRPFRIQFSHRTNLVPSTRWRHLPSFAESLEMKCALAIDPEHQINVFVTGTWESTLGFSIFPWDTNALTCGGGTVVSERRFGEGEVALTHELGHALGLWHTHHGSELLAPCAPCWERTDGVNADSTGDRCSDTPPTPLDGNAQPIGDRDPCADRPWPAMGVGNFMSAVPWLQGRFTPQQAGRMHAWITNRLSGWLDTNTPAAPSDFRVAANDFGEVELNWTDNSWNETGFRIERSLDGTNFVLLTNLQANVTSFFDDTSRPHQLNFYRVFATNALAGAISYATWPPRSAVPVQIAPITYVNRASTNVPSDGTELFPFLAFADALTAATNANRNIFRVSPGEYNEPFFISNKAVRVESRGGSVIIGQPGGNAP